MTAAKLVSSCQNVMTSISLTQNRRCPYACKPARALRPWVADRSLDVRKIRPQKIRTPALVRTIAAILRSLAIYALCAGTHR
jgi:hypothetical protein